MPVTTFAHSLRSSTMRDSAAPQPASFLTPRTVAETLRCTRRFRWVKSLPRTARPSTPSPNAPGLRPMTLGTTGCAALPAEVVSTSSGKETLQQVFCGHLRA